MYSQVVEEEAVSRVTVALFALRTPTTAVCQLSSAVDKPAPSGMLLQLHLTFYRAASDIPKQIDAHSLSTSRWHAEPWSPCSASCGGGSQTRRVRCMKGPDSRWREVGSQHCHVTGRRPSIVRVCNQQPCGRWTTTQWGPVSPSAATVLLLMALWLFLSAHVKLFPPLFLIWVRSYSPVSRSVCWTQFGHSVPTRLLPRRQRHQSP